jgi:hypothetical protein
MSKKASYNKRLLKLPEPLKTRSGTLLRSAAL